MTRDEVIAEARSWLKVPWKHQGRSRKGVDCVGLVVMVAQSFGLPVDDRTDYGRDPSDLQMIAILRKQIVFVPPSANRVGTVGIFRQVRVPCHIGILAMRNGYFSVIHARSGLGVVTEEHIRLSGGQLVETGAFPGLVG
jgi:cell wall-associated NlpC family hydrolase